MLKKTTVYLSDTDFTLLKKKATSQHKTVAEIIRLSIRQVCQPQSKDEQMLWETLDKIWAQTEHIDHEKIEDAVDTAVAEVRRDRKTRRRS